MESTDMHSRQSPSVSARDTGIKTALILGTVIAYALIFASLYPIVGGGISTLAVLPAVTAGWLLGLRSGLLCGLLMIPLNSALFTLLATPSELQLLSAIPSSIAIVASGAAVGWLRKLLEQVKQQAIELAQERKSLREQMSKREGAEEALRRAHDELETRVHERTAELEAEITERQRAEEQIKASLKEKEALLQEIHHRVKNNLQVISSLLHLQSSQTASEQTLGILRESESRVRSMALVHEALYRSPDLARVNFAEYIDHLTTDLFRSYGVNAQDITLKIDVQDVALDIDTAIPCGLIINELVSNALKHAFPDGRKGEVRVDFQADGGDRLVLAVSDDGVGLPENADLQDMGTLGLQLVSTLTRQIEGDVKLDGSSGTAVRIGFNQPSQ